MTVRLKAPRSKVLPYLRHLEAHGEHLLTLPLETRAQIGEAFEHADSWYSVLFQAISRGFERTDSDELNVNMVISRTARTGSMDDDERVKYRERIAQMLAIVREAIAACR